MTEATEAYELGKMGSQFIETNETVGSDIAPIPPGTESRGFCSRLLIEPALAGSMMAIFLAQTSLQNLYLRTACLVDLNFTQSICDKGVGEEFREAEIASQELVSQINVSRGFVGALISTVVLLFLGPWSDCSRRRKPLIIMSLLGMCVSTFNVLIMITFPVFSSIWVLYMVQIPMSIGGNFGLLLAAGFSYIGDVCHATGRNVTMTMGKHRAFVQCATVVGSLSGPLLYRSLGFYGVFPIVFFLQVSALLFVIYQVKDVRVNTENRVSVLDVRLPVAAAKCLLAPRDQHRRCIVLMMMVVALADRMILAAEVSLWYMYARNKFHWDDILFGGYIAYRNIISFIGTLIILRVFKSRLNLSDAMVGVLSGLSLAVAEVFLIAARSTAIVFCVPLVAIIAQGSQVVQRPIVNKQIRPDEQGKIYSVVAALEQACQMAVSPVFSLLYSKTAEKFPDAWLIPCVFIACIQTTAFAVARSLSRRQEAIAHDDPKEGQDVGKSLARFTTDKCDTDDKSNEVSKLLKHKIFSEKSVEKINGLDNGNFKSTVDDVNCDQKDYLEVKKIKLNDSAENTFKKEFGESNENLKLELNEELQNVLKAVDNTCEKLNFRVKNFNNQHKCE